MDTGATVTQIGKYQVLGVLGVGGMGVVYRGMDKSVGREVAIKTLTEVTDELRQRFLLEARSGVLNHPNIVTVYDFGEQDGNPYIVMEFILGDSLENLLRAGRPFSLIEKLDMIRQLCVGLGYAHQKGVIHRDVKPANMMVQPDGHIKIVDFGVARLENRAGHTQTGMVIGTFHYISPERLLGKTADGRADIWSAGVILYLLLTGRLPFPGDDPATLHRVIREPHEPISNFLSDYPSALDHVVDHALAKNPLDRYETAEELAADIEAINEILKRERVGEVLGTAKQLMEQGQWTRVRPLLVDLQRQNPQNTEVKKVLREVQDKLSRQQRTVQLQQFLGEAEEAVLTQRYAEALEFYEQAREIDPSNPELAQKIEHIHQLKEKADKVINLLQQAREARGRSDFGTAGQLIDKALQLDERNTDLRNERARIVQEAERATRERARREFSDNARSQLAARQYTEAIKSLLSALEIDPTDSETQQLYQAAIEQQEEQRRRKIIDQIVAEISESIAAEDYGRALTQIQRAQERLPGEAVLLQLRIDAEAKQREQAAKKLVEKTSLQVYNLFLTSPREALTVVQQALEQMPGEPQLIALQEKVIAQNRKASAGELKSQALKQAQAAIDAKQFDQAVRILETAAIECGETPDIAPLLNYAREQKRKVDHSTAASNAIREAQALLARGDYEATIALLEPVALATGDASVDQLLRQAQSGLSDLARRIDAVMSRAQTLSETDVEQALQLLAAQPRDIQGHSRVIELRARLESTQNREQVTTAAIRGATEALQRRDLRSGLDALESIRTTYGDSPRLAAAIAQHTTKRQQIANEQLTAAIEAAKQAMQKNDRARAAEVLNQATNVAEFADAGLQDTLKRMANEAAKTSAQTQVRPAFEPLTTTYAPVAAVPVPVKAKGGFPWGLLIGVLVGLLGAAGAGYWFFLRPAPPPPIGILELNASPFAEVVSVTSEKGKAMQLPVGDHWTPMRLDEMPTGKYTVSFRGADGSTQQQQCDVSESGQICDIELKPIDDNAIEEIIGGAK